MSDRVEFRDGKEYRVSVLPAVTPPANRSARTRYHQAEVGKKGDVGAFIPAKGVKRKRRKKKGPRS